MLRFALVSAVFGFIALAGPTVAQGLTDEELLQMFLNQRDAFQAARESTTGRTRGLTLVTIDDVNVTTASPSLKAPAAGGDVGQLATGAEEGVSIGVAPLAPAAPDSDRMAAAQSSPEAQPQPIVFGNLAPELQVNAHIAFAFDSAALTDDQKPLLEQLCKVMRGSDIQIFRIVGHTDTTGSDKYNEKLSQLRAEEVQRYLVNDCGIAPERLEAVGLGERFPADVADPTAAVNRRVEFQALS